MSGKEVMTVKDLIAFLAIGLEQHLIETTDQIYLSSDEEGNSFSILSSDGIEVTEDNRVILYPLYPEIP